MPSPVINVGGSGDSSPLLARNGLAPSPPSPQNNPDGLPLGASMRRAPSTPPLLQGGLSYSVQLPPTFAASSNPAIQQLPPACGARQLSKLKRFLTTLMQFGDDISSDVGDQVRSLILALVNSAISTEEFHAKLQETTNFPLRPFVIPFLKTNLPFLQRELLQCARLTSQYPDRYLNLPTHPSTTASLQHVVENFGPPPPKRQAPHLFASSVPQEQHIPPFHGIPRRSAPSLSETRIIRGIDGSPTQGRDPDQNDDIDVSSEAGDDIRERSGVGGGETSIMDVGTVTSSDAVATSDVILESQDADSPTPHPFESRNRGGAGSPRGYSHLDEITPGKGDGSESVPEIERDIYYVYHLLSTVSVMMEKARLSLESIRSRNSILRDDEKNAPVSTRPERSEMKRTEGPQHVGVLSVASPGTSSTSSETAQDLSSYSSSNREANDSSKTTSKESTASTGSATSGSVASGSATSGSVASGFVTSPLSRTKLSGVITEVERAIRVVESKTSVLISDADVQRAKLLKRKATPSESGDAADAAGRDESRAARSPAISSSALKSSLETIAMDGVDQAMFCWNCGREANETCSGCNKAKYCGSFCQHKDWDVHHKNCAQLKEATDASHGAPEEKCEDSADKPEPEN